MAACCGYDHTITLAQDGTLYSFGFNGEGQLCLGDNNNVALPSQIPNLHNVKQVSCGGHFTVCVDDEGLIWSFGENNCGQLGTGNTTNFAEPQKVECVPPAYSVSCGARHTLIITNDSNLLVCGHNGQGQLFLDNTVNQSTFQETSFSNISKISAGGHHSLFQNYKGEIYGCGRNNSGEVGLGHFNHPQITVSPILNQPENIVQFCCGYQQSYFLDSRGNVFSVGFNAHGNLGLGHNKKQNTLNKIPNIPAIKLISTIGYSCYLLDFEGNVWSFGFNGNGELGHGDTTIRNVPTKIESLKNIQQLSNGSCGGHFLAKDSTNIFLTGNNGFGQLGTGDTQSCTTPKEINPQYFEIWGNQYIIDDSISPVPEIPSIWGEEELKIIEMLRLKIQKVKFVLESNNNNKIKQEFPQNSFGSWNEVDEFLHEKLEQIDSKMNKNQKDVQILENELIDIENQIQQLQERKKEIEENLLPKAKEIQRSFEDNLDITFEEFEKNQKMLQDMCSDVSVFCKNENEMNEELIKLYSQKKFEEFDCLDISKLLWKMDLTKYQYLFELNQINGEFTAMIDDWKVWKELGVENRDCYFMIFSFEMMKTPGYSKTLSSDYEHDCFVCSHANSEKTIHYLKEYDIPIESDIILKNNYCTPILIVPSFRSVLVPDALSPNGRTIMTEITKWKKTHKLHLKNIKRTNKY